MSGVPAYIHGSCSSRARPARRCRAPSGPGQAARPHAEAVAAAGECRSSGRAPATARPAPLRGCPPSPAAEGEREAALGADHSGGDWRASRDRIFMPFVLDGLIAHVTSWSREVVAGRHALVRDDLDLDLHPAARSDSCTRSRRSRRSRRARTLHRDSSWSSRLLSRCVDCLGQDGFGPADRARQLVVQMAGNHSGIQAAGTDQGLEPRALHAGEGPVRRAGSPADPWPRRRLRSRR